jgi:hypothetical protein
MLATEIDTVNSSITYLLGANVENLVLTGIAAINGIGNALNNVITSNSAGNSLSGGLGKDTINLDETNAATDTVWVAAGDSLVTAYDVVSSFKLGTGVINTTGVDKLDLANTTIAADTTGSNGVDFGIIHSHRISNGIIRFDDVDSYTTPLAITASTLTNVVGYLQANITGGNTVAFVAGADTYIFQDGVTDTLVELVGVTASSLNTTGLASGAVWLV